MVAALAACVTVWQATRAGGEQRRVRQAEKQSRYFQSLVLEPVRLAVPVWIDGVCTLFEKSTRRLASLKESGATHQEMLDEAADLATGYDALFYHFKATLNAALSAWPSSEIVDAVNGQVAAIQDADQRAIGNLCSLAGGELPTREALQLKAAEVLRLMLRYDLEQLSGDPESKPPAWHRIVTAAGGRTLKS